MAFAENQSTEMYFVYSQWEFLKEGLLPRNISMLALFCRYYSEVHKPPQHQVEYNPGMLEPSCPGQQPDSMNESEIDQKKGLISDEQSSVSA